ncbi:hypothetical protein GGS23DRAFT_619132 [Durotheca rogersii]|uniref:uncharacterized protein n=1 Tax=Durotheca rogersii TaxID=419775 RepID=UPI00221FDC59|nr:uncharacterized protein GGS23DRAFT_619132 [Durotheca rogersii]KAI5864531.1 hypothetical protein GGS23DRAFT_619132 [Durotheca rogersii]
MLLPRWSRVWALFYLIICLNVVIAGPLGPNRRQEDAPATAEPLTTTTREGNEEQTTTPTAASEPTTDPLEETTTTAEVTTSATSTPTLTQTPVPSAINGNDPSDESFVNDAPIVPGELPLPARLTPGWGVAGAILLITGAVYTLVGMKNAWLQTFFSSACLVALCITVLILYVMNLPTTDAIQGAYVVAVVCSGAILGGAATAFRELTEGLGCLLGGFCLAMWLLTLREGGLIPSTVGKVVFIAVLAVVGFALYFSHYTRPYALIGLMSFAGATVTVLGIDCYSRAGLKEFWAYIWNLNDRLFPLDTTTYPLTKGIKVEIAVVVVLAIIGVVSQIKLWRVIQEHRAKRAEEQAEFRRMREEEEETVGRRVEEDNERERRQWETVYGEAQPSSPTVSHDSGVGEMDNEKRTRVSHAAFQPVSPAETVDENTIEMAQLSESGGNTSSEAAKQACDGLVVAESDEDKRVTIRVSRDERDHHDDDSSPMPEPDEKAWMAGASEKTRSTSPKSLRSTQRISNMPAPEVIPLPFKVPESHEAKNVDDDDRSSFATFADEDERSITMNKRASRASLSKRFSAGSANLLESLSRRSKQSLRSKQKTGEVELPQPSSRWAESGEELMPAERNAFADIGSVAATIDGLSDDGEDRAEPSQGEESGRAMEIKAELAGEPSKSQPSSDNKTAAQSELVDTQDEDDNRPFSLVETVATDILNTSLPDEALEQKPEQNGTSNVTENIEGTDGASPISAAEAKSPSETSKPPKSTSPSVASSASLTKERLPSSLSRVALSYRTNEWAKHLSLAEKPELETLQLNEYPEHDEASGEREEELPVPVNVDELRQTPESGIPAAPISRTPSTISNAHSNAQGYRSSPRTSLGSAPFMSPAGAALDTSDRLGNMKGPAAHGHGTRAKGRRQSGDVAIQPILEERSEQLSVRSEPTPEEGEATVSARPLSGPSRHAIPGVVSYSSPQTLIGKREMFLRHKTLALSSSAGPEASPQHHQAEAAALAGPDADDLPLSQRRELMRNSSFLSATSATGGGANTRPSSALRMAYSPGASPTAAEGSMSFDSHPPQWRASAASTGPSAAQREAQLSSFRQSVAAELRTGAGRETPQRTASASSAAMAEASYGLMEHQRTALLSQRDQEALRREIERRDKERSERAFEERMRRGDLIDAHREAMRRMQSNVRDQ